MEYLIGFYLVGWVICSLYIACQIKVHRFNFRNEPWWNTLGIAIFTCTIWPVFLGWCIYTGWKNLKIL